MAEEVTLEQAEQALQQLIPREDESEGLQPETIAAEPSTEVEPVVATEEGTPVVEVAEDDLESLKQRNAELTASAETAQADHEAQLQALQGRHQENEQILRNRMLQKSTVTDNALKILEAAQSTDGVSEVDVTRAINEIKGTMNPASTSYVAPQVAAPIQATEEQSFTLNNFLNEKGMTQEAADQFGQWMRTTAPTAMSQREQDVAGQSLDGFLRLAHHKWQGGLAETDAATQRSDAVAAVKSVKKAQKEAASAASVTTTAPKKPHQAGTTAVDETNLTPDDISKLVRLSTTQYH